MENSHEHVFSRLFQSNEYTDRKRLRQIKIFRGKLRLLSQISRVNLRQSFITLIGITIAMSMISASIIYVDSNKTNYYLEALDKPVFERPLDYILHDESSCNFSLGDIDLIQGALNTKFEQFNIDTILKQSSFPYTCWMSLNELFFNSTERINFIALPFTETLLEDSINGSAIPSGVDEVWIYLPSSITTEVNLSETINLSISYSINDNSKYYNISLNIVGMLNSTGLQSSFLSDHTSSNRINVFMQTNTYLTLHNILRTLSDRPISSHIEYCYVFDFSQVTPHTVLQTVENIEEFGAWGHWSDIEIQVLIQDEVIQYDFTSPSYIIYSTIQNTIFEFSTFGSMFIILSIPALITSFLLVNFSLGLINEGRRKSLALYKMRGISKPFLFAALSFETFILAIMASFVGLVLSIPVYYLISTTTGYMRFDYAKLPDSPIVSQSTIISVVGMGLIITFLVHFRTIVKLANASIVYLEEEASKKKPRKKGRTRQNFDVFLLIQGIIGIFLLNIFMELITDARVGEAISILFLPIIMILGFFSPLSLLIGFIFAYNRLMPVILDRLGRMLWKKDRKILAIATRNLNVNMRVTTRTTMLIALTISFLMILSSLLPSLNQQAINTTYYKAGSDIVIYTRDLPEKGTVGTLSAELNALPGLTSSQVSIFKTIISTTSGTSIHIEIMGIEANFAEVAFWKANYATKSISTLVATLHDSEVLYPVIIDSSSAKIEKLSINDEFLLNLTPKINMTITDKTDFWPRLIERYNADQRFYITTLSALEGIANWTEANYIFCKIASNTNQSEVVAQVKSLLEDFGVDLSSFYLTSDKLEVDPDSLVANVLWIITNFDFLVALIVLLILLFLFNITRITNHAKEIGLSRALGMKFKQVFLLMFTEPFLLVVISGIPGALIGLGILMTFSSFGQGPPLGYDPPMMLIIDTLSVILIFGSILVITVLSSFIASYRATRANVSKILKVE